MTYFGSLRAAAVSALFASTCTASAIDRSDTAPAGSAGHFWPYAGTLQTPPTDPSLYFGAAVDMSGNYLAVGSQSPTDATPLAGRVHVYRHSAAGWQLDAALVSPDAAQQGSLFGNSVALAQTPEGIVLVVGEPGRDRMVEGNPVPQAGTVWVFTRIDGAWVETRLGAASSPHALLGFSVDTDGSHVIAGKPGYDGNHGEIVVWQRDGEVWNVDHSTTAFEVGASFGYSVAIAGNLALIGAPGASYLGDSNAGLVLVMPLLFDDEPFSAVLHDPTPDATELFGITVAATADRFAVGSIEDDAPGGDPDSGSVHVFRIDGDDVVLDATLRSPAPQQDANFGSALAFADDYLVVGERFRDVFLFGTTFDHAGAAHLFRRLSGDAGWSQETSFYNFGEGEQMGWSVAMDAQRIAIGVPTRTDDADLPVGAVDLFESDSIFADGFD